MVSELDAETEPMVTTLEKIAAAAEQWSGKSAHETALALLHIVASVEGRDLGKVDAAGRVWVLDTFAECLKTVWAPDERLKRADPPA
jgi:hypothetical protein